ncbi:hypothetical protein QBC40DRAFT_341165 [Triangularia verruculosa]|uniref:Uncharacterized protein n=1 Tax=Triangularia verruculosa TaxID=2587418 RepID=A0AAN6XE96_9PEZI|nr:hypothetical protein QBC40DRAFT_341165 [Triangularia verruculosa]
MKLRLAAIVGGLSVADAQNQTVATWFSTSTAALNSVSTRRVVHYGNTPVTPIPTSRPAPIYETVVIHEPIRSRNINLTTTWYNTQATSTTKTELVTVFETIIGISTTTVNGTETATAWVTPTVATVTFTPTLLTETRSSFPTAVTSYVKVISHTRIFAYTSTTIFYTFTPTVTAPTPPSPITTPCPPNTIPTITQHIRCHPTNLISSRDDRGVGIRWDAGKDPSVCCQLCVDNEGCAGSEWKRDWGDGCRLYYYFGGTGRGGGGGGGNGTCGGGEELVICR